MKRRTVLKRVGIASAGAAAATGNAAAKRAGANRVAAELDSPLDVSDVTGEVALADVLTDDQLADLDGDPSTVRLAVDAGVDEIAPSSCCSTGCCDHDFSCDCGCCLCRQCKA